MFHIVEIENILCIHPTHFSKNFHSNVYNILNKKLKGLCLQQIGYITELLPESLLITDELCIEYGYCRIVVKCKTKCILPKKGLFINVIIQHVTSYGIFVEYIPYLKCIVPHYLLEKNFLFRQQYTSNCYVCIERNQRNGMTLNPKDYICVEILETQYNNQEFTCIAQFIEKIDHHYNDIDNNNNNNTLIYTPPSIKI